MAKYLLIFLVLFFFFTDSFGQNSTKPDKPKKESKSGSSKAKKEEKVDPMSEFDKAFMKQEDPSEIKVIEVDITDTSLKAPGDSIFDAAAVQEQAEYPGGMRELMKFLSSEIKYPQECEEKQISGKVWVEFVVDKKGKIAKTKVKRSAHPLLDAEAIRVVNLFLDWKPAKHKGENVSQRYLLPINFKLPPKEEDKK
jgi:TonB family protein